MKKRPRRVFGRVRFEAGGVEYIATMNRSGVTIRRLHGRAAKLATFFQILDAISGQKQLL